MANTRYQVGDLVVITDNYYHPARRGLSGTILSVYKNSHGTSYYLELSTHSVRIFVPASYLRKSAEKQPSEAKFLKLLE